MKGSCLRQLQLGSDFERVDDDGNYVFLRKYRSKSRLPIANIAEPPCTPRRRLANALALDSEFNVLEKKMGKLNLEEEKKQGEGTMECAV